MSGGWCWCHHLRLVLGITGLQHSARWRAGSSRQALAGDGRKEVNESLGISAQPFLLSFKRFR